ncbi:hypothetical protein FB451DRAFT_1529777 [Mycena latifolia]|nr:hypothetical protein FB451DRAFT_1529777 [Mycena latifolia]
MTRWAKILYGYFDPDSLFPDLWNDLNTSAESADPISPQLAPAPPTSTATSALPFSSTAFYKGIQALALSGLTPLAQDASVLISSPQVAPPSPATSHTAPSIALTTSDPAEPNSSAKIIGDSLKDSTADKEALKVPPSAELTENGIYRTDFNLVEPCVVARREHQESSVYFCGINETTDRATVPTTDEFDQDSSAETPTSHDPELSVDLDLPDSELAPVTDIPEPEGAIEPNADALFKISPELERYFASFLPDGDAYKMSLIQSSVDNDSGTVTETEDESSFDSVPDPETPNDPLADVSIEINAELERYFASCAPDHDEPQMSPVYSFNVHDGSSDTENDDESLFNSVPGHDTETEPDSQNIDSLSTCSFGPDSDRDIDRTMGLFQPTCDEDALDFAYPPANTISRSDEFPLQDFQHDLRTPVISFEPYTEHPSNPEPFKRAESQPFTYSASYVDYFVPELFELKPESPIEHDQVVEPPVSLGRSEPEEDPPSYQESIRPLPSFASLNHRLKAKCLCGILLWISLCFRSFSSVLFDPVQAFFRFSSQELELTELDLTKHGLQGLQGQDDLENIKEPVPPDKGIEAESFPFFVAWIFRFWIWFSRGLFAHRSSVQELIQEDLDPSPHLNVDLGPIELCDASDHPRDFYGQDNIEIPSERVPPDKIST